MDKDQKKLVKKAAAAVEKHAASEKALVDQIKAAFPAGMDVALTPKKSGKVNAISGDHSLQALTIEVVLPDGGTKRIKANKIASLLS